MITRAEAAAHADHARLLDGLNPEQRAAVLRTEGPVLVLAGAGSGKTRVITRRIAHLLAQGVSPRAVLAVTFTNKAAREMRERVGELVGRAAAKELTVSTFHAFCVRILRRHAEAAGLSPTFTICDESDQLSAVKGALRELRIAETAVHPKAALGKVSLFKNRLVTADQALSEAVDDFDELVAKVYRAYDAHLRRSRTVDFDDLLLLARRLLADRPEIRAELQDRYRYLLVDEYQDTNGVQYEILRLLAGERRNLFVVGDDDQSIYGWRGADIRKILGFNRDFPEAQVIRLETNYRSTPEILEAANKVIRNNPARHDKTLRPAAGPGDPIRVFETDDEEHEAAFVVDEISRETRSGKAKFGDYAILFRTAIQPRAFEARLRAARIPYDLVGGLSFFDRKEVRDLVAFLRLAVNPHDEPSLLRVINVPPRGIGKTSVDRVVEAATREGRSAAEVLDGPPVEGLTADARASIARFRARLAAVAPRVAEAGLTAALRELIGAVDYKAEIERCYPDALTRQARWAAVEEIVNLAENHERRTPEATLSTFLEEVALSSEEREEDEKATSDRVTLMTLHAAKGLEFPRVYLVGVEEGLLPHARAVAENTVEEERRLMYVGITRARRHLTLTRAVSRAKYGRREGCRPSRFIAEMRGQAAPPSPPAAPSLPSRPKGRSRGSR